MRSSKPFLLPIIAVGEWLMMLPATLLLGAGMLRLFQPRQYEPAHTSWIIFEWATTHISGLGAGILFIGLPSAVVVVGCAAVLNTWRENHAIRQDATAALDIFRRHRTILFLTLATLLAAAVLAFTVVHVIID